MINKPASTHQSGLASVDTEIDKIPKGIYNVRILGIIVAVKSTAIVLNDGTGQLNIDLGPISGRNIKTSDVGRAIVQVNNDGTRKMARLLAWNQMNHTLIEKYASLVKIERRIPI